ncbi:MAG: copper amine oxidase N-terminal domain-containing protein [Clostridiales Family XIII bacterium]|jgi:hypothetical protein|nr:copper amine oxidase N-terminal domain-containing protein [Clostridiales Family XIII bacterium]
MKKRIFSLSLALAVAVCLALMPAAVFAEEAKTLQNIALQIPGTDVSFTLENVFDECEYEDSSAYLDYWVFYIEDGGSLTFNYPITVTSEYTEDGALKDGELKFEAKEKIVAMKPYADAPFIVHSITYVESDSIYVEFIFGADSGVGGASISEMVEVGLLWDALSQSAAPATPVATLARPTLSTVLANGESVAFDAYNIGGNNYFKLRDLAYTLNGTEKQFEVGWDGAANAIALTGGKPYIAVGGEMADKGVGDKTATPTTSKIFLDGNEVTLTAYNIDGNNYFKLRDIGVAFDFGVDWDGAKNTIVIDTSKGYTPE